MNIAQALQMECFKKVSIITIETQPKTITTIKTTIRQIDIEKRQLIIDSIRDLNAQQVTVKFRYRSKCVIFDSILEKRGNNLILNVPVICNFISKQFFNPKECNKKILVNNNQKTLTDVSLSGFCFSDFHHSFKEGDIINIRIDLFSSPALIKNIHGFKVKCQFPIKVHDNQTLTSLIKKSIKNKNLNILQQTGI